MPDEPWSWSATELAAAIRSRRISARESLASCFARMDAVNPAINAVIVMVLIVGIYIWLLDTVAFWAVYDLVLNVRG